VKSLDGDLKGVDFHMVLKFTELYPLEPPKVLLCTHIPHANVFEDKKSKQWTICLDMLQQGEFAEGNMKGIQFIYDITNSRPPLRRLVSKLHRTFNACSTTM
jgi:ubiquitin-protein ligase